MPKKKIIIVDKKPPTAISLFSGMGGDSLGLKNAGFKIVAFNEFNKAAIESHKLNFPDCKLIGNEDDKYNITKVTDNELLEYNGKIDLIFAGFPCQGFSHAGKKLPNDPRNTLFREFVRTTHLINPKYIIGENVDALLKRLSDTGEAYINIIKQEFEKIGYKIYYQVLKANNYNVPQERKRLIIVGIREDINKEYKFPDKVSDYPNLIDIIKFDLKGAIKIDKDHYNISTQVPVESIMTDMNNDDTEDPNDVHAFLKRQATAKDFSYQGKTHKNLISFGKRGSPNHIEVINLCKPSKTIISSYDHQPRLFVAVKNKKGCYLRTLLVDELKQIQGFPADYKIAGSWKEMVTQIGNAVPPPMIEAVARQLLG